MNSDFYKYYTSTSMLLGQDERKMTYYSIKYFNHHILHHLPHDKEANILDIGCGYGRYLKALITSGYINSFGIDVSQEQINYARDNLFLINVEYTDAISYLEKIKCSYDAILLLDVIEHIDLDDSIKLLKLIHHSLSNEGILIIQVPNAISPLSIHRYWDITHQRAYTVHSIEQCLRLCGFSTIKHFALPPFIHGVRSFFSTFMWHCFFKPLLSFYMFVANGNSMGGIYTSNMLTIAKKNNSRVVII